MSELDFTIPPEISNDELYYLIEQLAQIQYLKHVLEIGSSSGGGSTQAFLNGFGKNLSKPSFYCVEVSVPRFAELKTCLSRYANAKCYNASSVPAASLMTPKDVEEFYKSVQTGLNNYSLERVLGWLAQDIEYIQRSGVPQEGIKLIKQENGIDTFDLVLIDGSAFSGQAELAEVYGAGIIILDDINDIKNYYGYQRLKNDPAYKLVLENWTLRNGYAVFQRV